MLALPVVALLMLAAPSNGSAVRDTTAVDSVAEMEQLQKQFESRLHWEQGHVTVQGGIAALDLPPGYRFLGPKDARLVLEKAWGNPEDESTLGLLFPTGAGPFTDNAWAVEISFDEDGYVKDDEARTIDYTKLLKKMQEDAEESNKRRREKGYSTVQLLGWAEPPRYDSVTHKLFWAKQLKFSGSDGQTLNYNIRVLGRRGVLVLNAISGMSEIDSVRAAMPAVLAAVNFNEGHRYSDFNPSKGDKVAAYGIAALVAGGVAAKAGLFKVLIGLLIAAKKFLLIAAVGLGAWLKKFFGKKSAEKPAPAPPAA
jgi:uncharacterized membrane-anchored protein